MRPARPGRGRAGPLAAALAPLALLLALGARPAAASSETVRSESAAAQQQPPCEAVGLSPGGTRVQRPVRHIVAHAFDQGLRLLNIAIACAAGSSPVLTGRGGVPR